MNQEGRKVGERGRKEEPCGGEQVNGWVDHRGGMGGDEGLECQGRWRTGEGLVVRHGDEGGLEWWMRGKGRGAARAALGGNFGSSRSCWSFHFFRFFLGWMCDSDWAR